MKTKIFKLVYWTDYDKPKIQKEIYVEIESDDPLDYLIKFLSEKKYINFNYNTMCASDKNIFEHVDITPIMIQKLIK